MCCVGRSIDCSGHTLSPVMTSDAPMPLALSCSLVALNRPEWHYVALGIIASFVAGGQQPLFAFGGSGPECTCEGRRHMGAT